MLILLCFCKCKLDGSGKERVWVLPCAPCCCDCSSLSAAPTATSGRDWWVARGTADFQSAATTSFAQCATRATPSEFPATRQAESSRARRAVRIRTPSNAKRLMHVARERFAGSKHEQKNLLAACAICCSNSPITDHRQSNCNATAIVNGSMKSTSGEMIKNFIAPPRKQLR